MVAPTKVFSNRKKKSSGLALRAIGTLLVIATQNIGGHRPPVHAPQGQASSHTYGYATEA